MAERFVEIQKTIFIVIGFFRIRNSSYRLSRPPNHIGRYKMVRHEKRERAVNR